MESLLPFVPVYSAAAVRAADLAAQRAYGLSGRELMRAAAAMALADLRARWPKARQLLVICGAGNNGGDGYDVARLAGAAGLSATVVALAARENLSGDALLAACDWQAAGGEVLSTTKLPEALAAAEVVVDALFGTGLSRPVLGAWAEVIHAINAAGKPVLAIDVPSGMDANTGEVLCVAVRAEFTSTFVGWKAGLFLNPGLAGQMRLHTLGVPAAAFANDAQPRLWQLPLQAPARLPRRARDAHKGRHGHVVVVGSDLGMPGAARLAGEAALRSGAGRVTVLTRADHAAAVVAGCPELMARPAGVGEEFVQQLAAADAIVCGPGLGRHAWGSELLVGVIGAAAGRPVVLDADALVLLAAQVANGFATGPQRLGPHFILTPHPGEAATLLGVSVADVQQDRVGAVRALVERFGATVVLKGAATLTLGPELAVPVACELGNPGMGTAGMGDVLAGVCAALAAQDVCDPAWGYARRGGAGWAGLAALAVVTHAAAGDWAAAQHGERGLLASDLFPYLRAVLNGREQA
jgi:NAD(P)H-hydrate epimerase